MKRDGRVHASKIDADALRDKNKLLAEGAIVFPTFDVGGYHRAIFANSGFFEVKRSCAITPNPNGTSSCTLTIPRSK